MEDNFDGEEDIKTGFFSDKEDTKSIGILSNFKKIHDAQRILREKEERGGGMYAKN
jgi:hypothetical protein